MASASDTSDGPPSLCGCATRLEVEELEGNDVGDPVVSDVNEPNQPSHDSEGSDRVVKKV
jgi:hypothetical protein